MVVALVVAVALVVTVMVALAVAVGASVSVAAVQILAWRWRCVGVKKGHDSRLHALELTGHSNGRLTLNRRQISLFGRVPSL